MRSKKLMNKKKNFSPKNKKDLEMACHTPPLKKGGIWQAIPKSFLFFRDSSYADSLGMFVLVIRPTNHYHCVGW